MASLDRALIRLYYQYRTHRETDPEAPFPSSDTGLPVQDGHVTVDAIATKTPRGLLDSLRALGLQNGAQAQRVVSGRLPIASLQKAAGLSLLQSMRAAQTRTRTNTGGMLPAPPPDANVETSPDSASTSQQSKSQVEEGGEESASLAESEAESVPNSSAEQEEEPASSSSGSEPVEQAKAAPTTKADTSVDRSAQAESTASSTSVEGPTDPVDDGSDGTEERVAPPTWLYVLGGIVILTVGLLVGLSRRA
jgi:hypothetical protein